MLQNVKVDIIYYKTNTDFEMEFNLCGCCRMRLLTNKTADRKSLIGNLSRAVSRSRVIIVVGNLFGDGNIIDSVSEAIGKTLSPVDIAAYGINSSEEINIISNSIPLVTQDGIFGGCIIESGPQTMILITDSKNIRKSIMKTLIHPYLEELYTAEMNTDSEKSNSEQEELEENHESDESGEEETANEGIENDSYGLLLETDEEIEETEPQEILNQEESEIEMQSDDDEEDINSSEEYGLLFDDDENPEDLDEDEEIIDLLSEAEYVRKRGSQEYNAAYSDFELDDTGLIGDDEFNQPYYGMNPITKAIVSVLAIILLLAVAAIGYNLFYLPLRGGISPFDYIKDIFKTLFG